MENFTELGLSDSLVSTISELGFVTPTPIQSKAIPQLLAEESDVVGLAQTGTGKTAAFGLPLIDLVDTEHKVPQALILAPTRELCLQIKNELSLFSTHLKNLQILPVYGGTDMEGQIRALRRGVHIIVATPGRLRDMIRRKVVQLSEIEFVVLDEADEMLSMGFRDELDNILEHTPDDKLTWLFSATMSQEVRRISRQYMSDPVEISVRGKEIANVDISHQYVRIYPSDRLEALKRFLDYDSSTFGLVFCRTRRDSKVIAEELVKDGYNADAIHGDLNQSQRDRVMARFRSKQLQILVATDVAARGIDVQNITHVFHFNIPEDLAFYTHRSGRTGRAGQKGISLIFAHPNDLPLIQRLERIIKITFEESRIPTGEEICEQQMLSYIQRIKATETGEALKPFLPPIIEELEELSKEELIERMATLSFNRFAEKYRHAPDLNPRKKKKRVFSDQMQKLFINIGHMDVESKGEFLALICDNAGISGHSIGRIEMKRTHTYFDVDKEISQQIKKRFKNMKLGGRPIRVNDGDTGGGRRGGGRSEHSNGNGVRRKKFSKRRT